MQKNCELCGKPLGEWPESKKPVMNGEQRQMAWITAILTAGALGLCLVSYKACVRDKDLDQARIPVEIERAKAEAMAHVWAKSAADRAYNDSVRAKAEADKAAAESKTAEAQARELSRREIYKACLAQSNDPALCSGQVQTIRCLPPSKAPTAQETR